MHDALSVNQISDSFCGDKTRDASGVMQVCVCSFCPTRERDPALFALSSSVIGFRVVLVCRG